MKSIIRWTENMHFDAQTNGHTVDMDAAPPLGKNLGMTPKELVAAGLGGCTAMDVIALLKKNKQVVTSFEIEVRIEPSSGAHPIVFKNAELIFKLHGEIDPLIALDAVKRSQTQYCGVSAMLSLALPITYQVFLNDSPIGAGQAHFSKTP